VGKTKNELAESFFFPTYYLPPPGHGSGFGNDKKAGPTEASNHGSWGVAAPILLPPSYFRIPIKGLFSLLPYGIFTMR